MSHNCRKHAAGQPRVVDAIARFHRKCLERHGGSMGIDERKALQSILTCRTEVMGGHRYGCEACGIDHFVWHSCNHRMCPVCGAAETADWVASKLRERLPVPHFMVTFTLPSQLRVLCVGQPRERFLRLFFAASAQAIKDVLADPRHLGGECGFFGMLQTWTQDLRVHPHIHFVVPALALATDGRIRRPKDPKWLARGDIFAARLRTLLLQAIRKEQWLAEAAIQALWQIGWNCDVKNFGSGENAMKYLGGYMCKGPISDSRILGIGEDTVTISVKDRQTGQCQSLGINGTDFVHRYLQHALPPGFHRVRYYGFMHGRSRKKLEAIRSHLKMPPAPRMKEKCKADTSASPCCKRCGKAMSMLGHQSRAPPKFRTLPHIWNHKPPAAA